MDNTIPSDELLEAARLAAWRRMRSETRALRCGTGPSHDQPHVAAWLAEYARHQVELQRYGQKAEGRRFAHQILLNAEGRYVEAILGEELDRLEGVAAE